MKIIFLNCWYGRAGQSFLDFVVNESINTDIFCFQEIQPELYQSIKERLDGFESVYNAGGKSNSYNLIYGQSIFFSSSLKKKSTEIEHLYQNTEFNKGFLQILTVTKNKKVINIYNLHGDSQPGDKNDSEARILQSTTIVNSILSHKGINVIGGDFNLNPETKSIKMITDVGYLNLIKVYNIKTTRNHFAWEQAENNFKAGKSNYYGKQHFADYCFVPKDLKVNKFEVPNNEISDHLPLVLEFEV